MTKREFLAASIGAGVALGKGSAAFAQQAEGGQTGGNRRIQSRMAKTTKLFKSPQGFPNALTVTPEGLWIGEQKMSGPQAVAYHLSEPQSLSEAA